ncbi:general odorant-binding protein 69a-like [Zootermopsis nevadensis]|uniref:Pheromone-binding protein-related protein 1 n=1 Tax=Zootermopsis nevadensis TaxID=136037 RepID=A0A067QVI9_ZOONE|nr:general odorant-binding protein 69a-like [Zootermopsis nevadensis]KDR09909.1 Pheromone-binding protein-related protein 1 [Zootermopsis nevadensis]
MKTQFLTTVAILILGSVCISAEFSGKAMQKAKEIDTKCRTEVGADKGYITAFLRGDIIAENLPKYKCYLKCLMVELDSLSHDGVYDIEEEKGNIPPEIVEEGHRIISVCKGTQGADACDTAYQLHKCYHDANPELYRRVLHHWDGIASAE